jgi:hypothetical protein
MLNPASSPKWIEMAADRALAIVRPTIWLSEPGQRRSDRRSTTAAGLSRVARSVLSAVSIRPVAKAFLRSRCGREERSKN